MVTTAPFWGLLLFVALNAQSHLSKYRYFYCILFYGRPYCYNHTNESSLGR